MHPLKLLAELNEDVQIITEGTGAEKKYYLEGIVIMGDHVNKNKRMYSMDILRPELTRYITEYVNKDRALGELGHPAGPTINLDKVSHRFLSLKEDGNNYVGRALVLDTPHGVTTQKLIDGGVRLGMSSRALGSLKMNKEGVNEVQNDLMIATAGDIVHDPSASEAIMQSIFEHSDWMYENGMWSQRTLDETRSTLVNTKKADLEATAIRLFQDLMNTVSK